MNKRSKASSIKPCDILGCDNVTEVRTTYLKPKGFIFKLFPAFKVDICQSCISLMFRNCQRDVA